MTQSAIYTTPLYLRNSWKSAQQLKSAFRRPPHFDPVPLDTFISACSEPTWDDSLRYSLSILWEEKGYNFAARALHFISDLADRQPNPTIYFGDGTIDPETNKYTSAAALHLISHDTNEKLPLVGGRELFGSGEASIVFRSDDTYDTLLTPQPASDSGPDYYIWRYVQGDRALASLLATGAGIFLEAFEHMWNEHTPEAMQAAAKRLTTIPAKSRHHNDLELDYFTIEYKKILKELNSCLTTLITYRFITWQAAAMLCTDVDGAYDWFCSVDGPAFLGPDAAMIQASLGELHRRGEIEYPDYLDGISVVSDNN